MTVPVFTGVSAEMSRAGRVVRKAEEKTEQLRARARAIDELMAGDAPGGVPGGALPGDMRAED